MGVWVDTRSGRVPGHSWQGPFFFVGGDFFEKTRCLMFWGKNGPKMIAIIQTIGKNGTLDPIKFWLVP